MTIIEELHASCVNQAELPFFDYAPGVQLKLLKVNKVSGQIVMLLKAEPGSYLGRHKHYGTVCVYTLSGKWRYVEDDWRASTGSFVYEPAGSIHTFEADKQEGLLAFLVMEGSLEFLTEKNESIGIDNWQSFLKRYYDHCSKAGIPIQEITKF
jgi:2,4'-dihydroxyacetophenone dioxygenase